MPLQRILRVLLFALAAAFASATFAQPVNWESDHDLSPGGVMTKDAGGNLYWVTHDTTALSSKLYVTKLSSGGKLIYKVAIDAVSSARALIPFQIVAANGRLFLLAEYGYNGAVIEDYPVNVYCLNAPNAASVWKKTLDPDPQNGGYFPTHVAVSGTNIALTGRKIISQTSGQPFARWLSQTDGSQTHNAVITADGSFGDAVTDSLGNLYAIGSFDTGTKENFLAVKFDPQGTVKFVKGYDKPEYANLYANNIALDEPNGRLYAIGGGNSYPVNPDVLALCADTTSGGVISFTAIDEQNGAEVDTGVVCDATGAYYSFFNQSATDGMVVVKLNPAGQELWRYKDLGPTGASRGCMAFDSFGDLLLTDMVADVDGTDTRFVRMNSSNGAVLWSMNHNFGGSEFVGDMLVASDGNPIVNGTKNRHANDASFIAKMNAAILTLDSSTVAGGALVTGTITLTGPAPAGGAAFALTSDKPEATLPALATVAGGGTTKSFTIHTQVTGVNVNAFIQATWRGTIIRTTLTVAAPTVAAFVINPNDVIGGVNSAGTVSLNGAAPTGGTVVNLISSVPAIATVPASVTIAAGTKTKGFTITTIPTALNQSSTISATTGAVTKTATIAIKAPVLIGVSVSPGSVIGGQGATLTLTLSGKAPTGGVTVNLLSGADSIVHVPTPVSVFAGNATRNVAITTSVVLSSVPVTIVAYRGSAIFTTTLTVNP